MPISVSCLEDWNFKQRFESEGLPGNLGGSGIDPFPRWMNPINPLSSIIPLQNRFIQTFQPDTEIKSVRQGSSRCYSLVLSLIVCSIASSFSLSSSFSCINMSSFLFIF